MKTDNWLLKSLKNQSEDLFERYKVMYKQAVAEYYSFADFPNYTDHGVRHAHSVQDNLSQIIPKELPDPLTPFELFALLSASLLHDVGMMSSESKEQQKVDIRTEHEIRTENFLLKKKDPLNLSQTEAELLSEVCRTHRKSDLSDLENLDFSIQKYGTIRVRFLSALLRLADILDVSFDRTPFVKMDYKVNVFHKSISNVKIRSSPYWEIVLSTYSKSPDEDKNILEIRNHLQHELDSLYPFLRRNGIFFKNIELKITHQTSPQIFIAYAHQDKAVAQRIAKKLGELGLDVWYDNFDLVPGDSLRSKIEETISSMDYLVVLLSPNSVRSQWVRKELDFALSRELTTRDITIIPVLVADCKRPAFLESKQYVDLRRNLDVGIEKLASQLYAAPKIDFAILNATQFEELVTDLLQTIGFFDIKREIRIEDHVFDLLATFETKDPFEVAIRDQWIVEVKFYKKERIDLRYLRNTVNYLDKLPERYRALIITNSQATSPTEEFLDSIRRMGKIELRVITGTELRRLLIDHPHLIKRYFK